MSGGRGFAKLLGERHSRPCRRAREVLMEIGTCDQILRLLAEMLECYPERAADLMTRIDSALDERLRLMRRRTEISI